MDGLEVQEALKSKGVTLPVIIMTGHGDVSLAVRAMKAGAIDFIEKPFQKAVLLSAVEQGFGRLRHSAAKRERRRRRGQAPVADSRSATCLTDRQGPAQQVDCLRSRHQPAYGRNPSGEPDEQAWRQKPLGRLAHRLCRPGE